MKLVITYPVGDGYTYSAQMTIPVEYESEEALAVDLENHCKLYLSLDWEEQLDKEEFKGTAICATDLIENGMYYAPDIYTLDQWWEDFHE